MFKCCFQHLKVNARASNALHLIRAGYTFVACQFLSKTTSALSLMSGSVCRLTLRSLRNFSSLN